MSNYIRTKSFSQSQLKISDSSLPQKSSAYFLFKARKSEPTDAVFPGTKINFSCDPLSSSKSRLQLFKSRLMRGLNRHRELAANSEEEGPVFSNLKINQMLVEEEGQKNSTKQFVDGSVFVRDRARVKSRTVYRFFSQSDKTKKENRTEQRANAMSPQDQKSEEQVKHSKSIMVIRKVNKLKEKFVQNKKERYEEEFYKAKETPIHHSQHFNNKRFTRSLEESAQNKRNSFRNRNAIKDIIRLRETLKKGSFEELKQFTQSQPFEVLVKGQSKFSQHFCFKKNNEKLKKQVEKQKIGKKTVMKQKTLPDKRENAKKEEEIGPW